MSLRRDHPSGQRMVAMAWLKSGDHARAFETIEGALKRKYPSGRHIGVGTVLKEDLGLIAAAWIKLAPDKRAEIDKHLAVAGGRSRHFIARNKA